MRTTNQSEQTPKVKKETHRLLTAGEVALTGIVFGIIAIGLLGGGHLMGYFTLPTQIAHWIGAGLIAYVVIGGITITHLCVRALLTKKG